ncbi:hypothetical protein BS50DRAFT_491527 [Corynespora cassiicola Philippines]|uniref:CENP-V/GFA domain-containing protein n=1 Tax=Corynespora cassiicola Philippines TaxID=1448308 RepID=A0A2T2NS61_CORCC|nr:hypothetical protein BS50DRAFT_491527 [Corynespora cassiicola Philippines]
MPDRYPAQITGGCLCASIRYTVTFPNEASWPPQVHHACQCTQCRKWLSSLLPIAISIPVPNISFPSQDSKDPSQLKIFESSPDVERKFCGKCGSGLTFQHLKAMPDTLELWLGTLDEEVLIGEKMAEEKPGEEPHREGGWGQDLTNIQETLFWGHKIEGVTDGGPGAKAKKWWGMIGQGTSFV